MFFVLTLILGGLIAAALAVYRYATQTQPCALCKQPNKSGHPCRFRPTVRIAKKVRRAESSTQQASIRTLFEGWLLKGRAEYWRCHHLHGNKADARACAQRHLTRCQKQEEQLTRRTEPRQITRSRALQRVVVDKAPRPSREIPVRLGP